MSIVLSCLSLFCSLHGCGFQGNTRIQLVLLSSQTRHSPSVGDAADACRGSRHDHLLQLPAADSLSIQLLPVVLQQTLSSTTQDISGLLLSLVALPRVVCSKQTVQLLRQGPVHRLVETATHDHSYFRSYRKTNADVWCRWD